jgi:hypothetical protein
MPFEGAPGRAHGADQIQSLGGPAKCIRFSLHTNSRREAQNRRDQIMSASEAKAKALLKSWRANPEH